MNEISTIHLRRLHGQLGALAYEMMKLQFSHFYRGGAWNPAINIYRCAHSIVVCLDLAGVDKKTIDLKVEPRRLTIRGQRPTPQTNDQACQTVQVLAMEIDSGPFERQVILPADIDTSQVTAEQQDGLVWIHLPLRTPA